MKLRSAAALAFIAALWSSAATAQEVTLKTITALPINTAWGEIFQLYIDKVNQDGKGQVQLRLLGGPEAVPPFESGNAIKNGVVDVGHIPGNYYDKLVPAATAVGLAEFDMDKQRQNGAFAYVNELHEKGLNARVLTFWGFGIQFHFYTTKEVTSADLTGLKIRTAPGFQDLVRAVGATALQTAPGEVYTALQRGVIDGYTWPIWGVLDLGWQDVTKFRVDPGWRTVAIGILINNDRYRGLSAAQRKVLDESALWFEEHTRKLIAERNAEERQKQAGAGIKTVKLADGDARALMAKSADSGWADIARKAPDQHEKLRGLLTE